MKMKNKRNYKRTWIKGHWQKENLNRKFDWISFWFGFGFCELLISITLGLIKFIQFILT